MSERFTRLLLQPEKVVDLLAANQKDVAEVLKKAKAQVEAANDSKVTEASLQAPLDDLFVLRFVLSLKREKLSSDQIAQAVFGCLQWRSERLDLLAQSAEGHIPFQDVVCKFTKSDVVGYLGGLHPVMVVRAGRSNTKGLFQELTIEKMLENSMMRNEQVFAMCDKRTRETGLLCKQIAVIDLEGFSLFKFDSKFSKELGKSSTLSSKLYPQLLGKTVIINM
jgi:hypothetical protein